MPLNVAIFKSVPEKDVYMYIMYKVEDNATSRIKGLGDDALVTIREIIVLFL